MIFSNKITEDFEVTSVTSSAMDDFLNKCEKIYRGKPYWVDDEAGIKTINFAKFICAETAKLSTLGMSIAIDGDSERIKNIQKQIDEAKEEMREWVEYAGAYGTIILKPNGTGVEAVLPDNYIVTAVENGKIAGIVFVNRKTSEDKKTFFTRFEYHRWIEGKYAVSNKCYKGKSENDLKEKVEIKKTPWKEMYEEVLIDKITSPLFGVLKMPGANEIDVDSSISLPLFSEALEELKDLDVAYSRNSGEIYDSERTILIDSDRMIRSGSRVDTMAAGLEQKRRELKLPRIVKNVMGSTAGDFYQEINPTLNTEMRIKGINSLLSQIGFKCGFSNGYFVFNESTGFTTATQVTADQARTIQLIDDVRKNIDQCIIELIKAINVFEDLYGETGHIDIEDTPSTPELERMIHVHYDPIYTNKEEDRQRALQLTNSGYYPKWYYLHMYEGMSEEEAKALTAEAQPKERGLFDE